jgi:hypothetical protein
MICIIQTHIKLKTKITIEKIDNCFEDSVASALELDLIIYCAIETTIIAITNMVEYLDHM